MPKYLYFQDGHAKGINSINRKGDFFADWLIKFDELLKIAKKHKVEAIIDGGDILDSPEPSYRILDEIADRIEKAKIPMYSLFGNHAERYHSIEHSKYTGLAHLQKRSKLFRYLDKIEGKNFVICGLEYSHNVEEDLNKNGWQFIPDFYKDCWKILVAHAFICPKEFPFCSHVVCDDIKTNADIVLVAHYHSQWQKMVGKTEYIDIGCFGRNSVTEANIKPSCLILDTDTRTYELILLDSAKPAEEAFDLEKLEALKAFDSEIETFIKSLESVDFQGQRIEDIINTIAKEKGIEQRVVDLIILKMKEIGNG